MKKVQKMWRDLKETYVPVKPMKEEPEVTLRREGLAQKFGMMIDVEATKGGHRISEIRAGGIVDVPRRCSIDD